MGCCFDTLYCLPSVCVAGFFRVLFVGFVHTFLDATSVVRLSVPFLFVCCARFWTVILCVRPSSFFLFRLGEFFFVIGFLGLGFGYGV